MDSVNFYSLNVRGLGQNKKRRTMWNWLRKLKWGVIFLQETHSQVQTEKFWSNEWGSKILFSHGTANSRGVAILFTKGIEFEVEDTIIDPEGRFLLVNVKLNDEKYTLVNIYAPTKDKHDEQKNLLDRIQHMLGENNYENLIMGGDFNATLNPKLDKKGGNPEGLSEYSDQIQSMCETLDLIDVWRVHNPNKQLFTWRQRKPLVQCRLDFWLISEHLDNVVEEVNIKTALKTDHSMISLSLSTHNATKRGRGLWKFNALLLRDKEYIAAVKDIIEENKTDKINPGLLWDVIKCKIRGFSVAYSVKKKRECNKVEAELLRSLKRLDALISEHGEDPCDDNMQEFETTKKELERLEESKTKGTILRAKARWSEHGEKCTKYFASLEKRNYKNKTIKQLDVDGKVVTDPHEILKIEEEFYSKLYSECKINLDHEAKAYKHFLGQEHPLLDEGERQACEGEVSEQECASALKDLKNGKSPGSDGFTVEFYKFFWKEIKMLVINSLNYAYQIGELSIEQKRGVITLIPKKGSIRTKLNNWRPITLLNIDYKIAAKVLASRIKRVLPMIINNDQVSYIPNRYIGENVRITADILDYTSLKKIPGILLLIDFEKAFDTIKWNFIIKALRKFNFGDSFVRWVKTLYNNIQTAVINNGMLTEFFTPKRGIRQGCPLSAYLFIIAVELLAASIRNDKKIKGVNIGKQEIKLSQYADDTTCYLADEDSLRLLLLKLGLFFACSGLRINLKKTKAKALGPLELKRKDMFGIEWTDGRVKSLGITHCNNDEDMYLYNFKPRIQNMKNLLNIWSQRDLSLKGKITVIKSLALPSLLFVSMVLAVPENVIKEVNDMVYAFLWSNRKAKVKKGIITAPIEKGGLKMIDFKEIIKAQKIIWVKRLLNSEESKWKAVLMEFYKEMEITDIIKCNFDKSCIKEDLPEFYKQILYIWMQVHTKDPSTVDEVRNQIIWNNKYITVEKQPILWQNMYTNGMKYIGDLLKRDGDFLTTNELKVKYNINITWLQHYCLRNAIPFKWRKLVYGQVVQCRWLDSAFNVEIGGRVYDIMSLNAKSLYQYLVEDKYRDIRAAGEMKWEECFNIESNEWKHIYRIPYNVSRETKLQSMQFKILHRIFPCKRWLFVHKVTETENCEECDRTDTLVHYFFTCPANHRFWQSFVNWWSNINCFNSKWTLTQQDAILGIWKTDRCEKSKIVMINYCMLLAKWIIHRCKIRKTEPSLYEFLTELRMKLDIEKHICYSKGEYTKFCSRFQLLDESV